MKVILLGAPGAGKGSQATKIAEHYNIPHISTGDAFRSNIARGTEIGVYAKSFMDKGQLVPDRVVIDILKERIAKEKAKQLEKERIAKEKAKEKERIAREKAKLLEKERIAKAKAKEKEKIAREKAAKLAKEKAKKAEIKPD